MGRASARRVALLWGLFLAGCGSHPTSATANPTLTMAAMAFRTLDKILEKLND